MSKDNRNTVPLSEQTPESTPEPLPQPVLEESVTEGETHTEETSTLVEPAERVKDPTVNQKTRTYPPQPTDGKS